MDSLVLFLLLSLALVPLHAAAFKGFAVELIHRDSPKSPLYDSTATRFDRWRAAVERSRQRVRHFASFLTPDSSSIVSPVVPNSGTYLMRLSLGTPPFEIHAIVDTGSDLTWTNCVPCTDCYKQKDPLFNPAKSSTYANLSCSSGSCNELPRTACVDNNRCEYQYSYGDGSTVTGLLAKDNFTFSSATGGHVSIAATVFGCSHESGGSFDNNTGGLVGLGGGELSLVSQLGDSIGNQFSYCLLPYGEANKSSQLVFGPNDRAPTGGKLVKTPLIRDEDQDTFFFLNLVNITVGDKSIPVYGSSSTSGNIIIDSGTTLTILDNILLQQVAAEVKKGVNLPPVSDPEYGMYGACFSTNGTQSELKWSSSVSFVFDGATVPLNQDNLFVQVDDNVTCLAMASFNDGVGGLQIYGNVAQQGFYVAYDLGKKQLSMAPANCAKI